MGKVPRKLSPFLEQCLQTGGQKGIEDPDPCYDADSE